MRRITIACWASFWPKKATSGPTELKSFATTVVTPRKCAGPRASGIAVEHVGQAARDLDRGGEALRVDLVGLRGVDEVDALGLGELGVAGLVARIAVEVLARAELGRVDEQAHDDDVAARDAASRSSDRWPSWREPIVGTRPIVPPSRRAGRGASRSSALVRDDPHRTPPASGARVRSASAS